MLGTWLILVALWTLDFRHVAYALLTSVEYERIGRQEVGYILFAEVRQ
jgi:hypothetical protein